MKKRRQYTVETKIKAVEYYLSNSSVTVREAGIKFGLSTTRYGCYVLSKWIRLYKDGLLKMDNTIAVSHRKVNKDTIVLKRYVKPTNLIVIDGVEYIRQELSNS